MNGIENEHENETGPGAEGSGAPGTGNAGGRRRTGRILKMAGAVVGALLILYIVLYQGVWKWGLCRVYVGPGETLVLTANLGEKNPKPSEMVVVPEPYKGVREGVFGEGRHFFSPITFDRDTSFETIEIGPTQIGLVESKSGKPLPKGEFLAKKGYKGILREVLTPGKWRLNPYAYKVTVLPATIIEPGFVGCVTSLSGKPSPGDQLAKPGQRGILPDVLQPGIHYLNPREFKVDVVEVGFRQISLRDVQFPSKDGFSIQLDISVVWGLEPRNVPLTINNFGGIEAVVDKVIDPQVESICRIEGSKYGAKEFIGGKTREEFQNAFTSQLEKVCEEKNITVLIGLVRSINVPKEVRTPIQKGKIAVEEKLTKEEQKTTQTVENELEELKADVRKGVREVEAETDKMVAEVEADGEKQIASINAETEVQVAEIMLKAAKFEAQKERKLGKAKADVEELMKKAEADELAQAILALGNPEDYARYIFAENLPDDIEIFLRYAGEGTLWTDLPRQARDLESLAALKILQEKRKKAEREK